MIRKFVPAFVSILALSLTTAVATNAQAAKKVGAAKAHAQKIEQLGKADAPEGGTFYFNLEEEPPTLNPFAIPANDMYGSGIVTPYGCETLAAHNSDTYDWEPQLAESWTISPDGKYYTFKIRDGAKFSDGTPLTAEDVKFSFDAIIAGGDYNTAAQKPYFDTIEKAEVVDGNSVKFTTKTKYFFNFGTLANGILVVPKKIYGDSKVGSKINKTFTCSGPYKLEKYEQGQRITMVKNPNWWGWSVPENKGRYKFERIVFRFAKEENIALEMLKKGELDFIGWLNITPELYTKKAVGPEWGKTVIKVKSENKAPKDFSFVGWNFKNELFKEKDIRRALAMLMDRPLMIQKFKFGMSKPEAGPWYAESDYADQSVKPIDFNAKAAQALLTKQGWKDSNNDGILDKIVNGKLVNFEFTLLYSNKDVEKYLTIYQEDLKKAGIKMNLKLLEWNAFSKALQEQNFDAVTLSWGGGDVDMDPKQIWHSDSAGKGGSNFISYKNPAVDKLIDDGRAELDRAKRIKIFRQAYKMIADDAPYAFMFEPKFALYATTSRVQRPADTYKYEVGFQYWYFNAK